MDTYSEANKTDTFADTQALNIASNMALKEDKTFNPRKCIPGVSILYSVILSAAMGSFLFGFNISLLNTGLDSILSEFRVCGIPEAAKYNFSPLFCPELCLTSCLLDYTPQGNLIRVSCPTGYTDKSCSFYSWSKAAISTAVLVGAAIACLCGGSFLPYGRRFLMLVTMIIFTLGVVTSTLASSVYILIWARLIVGFGIGLVSVISPTYMSEVSPPAQRGRLGVFHQLFIVIGIFIAVLLGLPLEDPSAQSVDWEPPYFQKLWWRIMLAMGILPVLACFACFYFCYKFETPVYYIEKGENTKAEIVLRALRDSDDVKEEMGEIAENVRIGKEYTEKGLSFLTALKHAKYRHVIIVGCVLSAFQQLGGINVFITSSNTIFQQAGVEGSMKTVMTCLMALLNCLMTFPTVYLIEKVGRRSLLLWGTTAQFLFIVPAAISYWTEVNPDKPGKVTQFLAVVGVLGYVTAFAVSYGPVLWVYLFEIYPMEIKDSAASSATAVNWISGIIMVFVSNVIPNIISFTLFAAMLLFGISYIFIFMLETKGRILGSSPFVKDRDEV